jgi:hypothetical protein
MARGAASRLPKEYNDSLRHVAKYSDLRFRKVVVAYAGYHSEPNHRIAREDMNVRSSKLEDDAARADSQHHALCDETESLKQSLNVSFLSKNQRLPTPFLARSARRIIPGFFKRPRLSAIARNSEYDPEFCTIRRTLK